MPDLTGLIYQADWTRLSMSATVWFEHDQDVEDRLFEQAVPAPGLRERLRGRRLHPVGDDADEDENDDDDEDDEDDGGERRLLLGAGGRYRVTTADGSLQAGCDGARCWHVGQHGEPSVSAWAGAPDRAFRGLLTPQWLLASYRLETTGEQQVLGRTAIAVRAIPRGSWPGPFRRPADLLDRVDVLVDAELGILLHSEQLFEGRRRQAAWLRDLVLDPAEAADAGAFAPPPGASERDDTEGDGQPPGPGRKLAESAVSAAAGAMSFAIRHAPRKPADDQPEMPASPWPAGDGDAPLDASPVDADLVNLLHRTGLPAVNLSCEMQHWTDLAALPAAIAESLGPHSVLLALAERAGQQGVTYRRARLRALVPVSYRLDYLTDRSRGRHSVACDGEHTTRLLGDRVVTSPATPPSRELRGMLEPSWLLRGWRLRPTGEVSVGGRTGIRLLARRPGSASTFMPGRLEVVVDTSAGILLRYTSYQGDRPSDCLELLDVRLVDGTVPGEFTIEPEPGMTSDIGTGSPLDLLSPQARQRTKHAVQGALAAGAAVSGWLDRLRGRPDQE